MEWTVASSQGACASCARAFDDTEEYWSVLVEGEEGFQRRDYCDGCWQGVSEEMFSHWRTRCKLKPAPPKRFVDDSVMLDFFKRLSESEDPAKQRLHFIMAVLLMRKRLLRERRRRRDGATIVWTVEAPRLNESFEVRDQGLSEVEVADILVQIGQVLNVELASPEEAPENPAESSSIEDPGPIGS